MNENFKDINDIRVKTYKINTIVYHADKFKPTIIVESKVKKVSIDIDEKGNPIVVYELVERENDDFSRNGKFLHEELSITAKEALDCKIKELNERHKNLLKDVEQKFNEMYNSTEAQRVEDKPILPF